MNLLKHTLMLNLFVITLLLSNVYASKVFCGKTKDCNLPGVGPTYSCGHGLKWSGYEAGSNEKYWSGPYTRMQDFRNCCEQYSTPRTYCAK
ncbi:uncharacterized protein BX663DRAFT_503738 [Cokeromyces recurvatus]|uniref:uncharacterized protein n=1 Tax=Cokeromyces recurvatus TaxID=90255 RepID=UPI0022207A0F|nr:uncharacterized protein BX663DRAFT_503738 [Cokeromyces recurvatus]KAI7904835.1 hypothetical protein BX663DRAFT_503738 [Cokeromyces recurvatus]